MMTETIGEEARGIEESEMIEVALIMVDTTIVIKEERETSPETITETIEIVREDETDIQKSLLEEETSSSIPLKERELLERGQQR